MMRRGFAVVLALGLLCMLGSVRAQEDDELDVDDEAVDVGTIDFAHVVVHKWVDAGDDKLLVVDRNFTLTYTVFNLGTATALDVEVSDIIPDADFEVLEGALEASWDKLEGGANVTFNATVVPRNEGPWDAPRARVDYIDSADNTEKSSLSSTFGRVEIFTKEAYEQRTAAYEKEWTAFGLMCAGPILAPLAVWYTSAGGSKQKAA